MASSNGNFYWEIEVGNFATVYRGKFHEALSMAAGRVGRDHRASKATVSLAGVVQATISKETK